MEHPEEVAEEQPPGTGMFVAGKSDFHCSAFPGLLRIQPGLVCAPQSEPLWLSRPREILP